jgi:hypothetical protein
MRRRRRNKGDARNHATFVHKKSIRRLDRIDATQPQTLDQMIPQRLTRIVKKWI